MSKKYDQQLNSSISEHPGRRIKPVFLMHRGGYALMNHKNSRQARPPEISCRPCVLCESLVPL